MRKGVFQVCPLSDEKGQGGVAVGNRMPGVIFPVGKEREEFSPGEPVVMADFRHQPDPLGMERDILLGGTALVGDSNEASVGCPADGWNPVILRAGFPDGEHIDGLYSLSGKCGCIGA